MRAVSLEQAAELLENSRRVLVVTHQNPDGDAIGCLSAAYQLLEMLGKAVVAYSADPIPERFSFLSGMSKVVSDYPREGFDLTLILDCSDERPFPNGVPPRNYMGHVLVLDHHKTIGAIADSIYCDPRAASAGVVLFRLMTSSLSGIEIDLPMAEALYCSLIADTGSFRYQNTNPEAMRMAASLLEAGVDTWRVASNLYEARPKCQVDLLAKVLATLRVHEKGRVAVLHATSEMFAETGCSAEHVDGFVNYGRGIEGVEVACLLREDGDRVRSSMRSRGIVDVSAVATELGGGGHTNAAGFSYAGTIVDAEQALLETLRRRNVFADDNDLSRT
jgi:phosphoesterase RecJ-like protein